MQTFRRAIAGSLLLGAAFLAIAIAHAQGAPAPGAAVQVATAD